MTSSATSTLLVINAAQNSWSDVTAELQALAGHVVAVDAVSEAVAATAAADVTAAVIDVSGASVDGPAIVEALRRDLGAPDLPCLFLAADEPTLETLETMYALGRVDFLRWPAPTCMLRGRLALLAALRRGDAEPRDVAHSEPSDLLRLKSFANAAGDYALFFFDDRGVITDWFGSAQHVFGYTADEAVGRSMSFVFTPEDRAKGAPAQELAELQRCGCANDERPLVRRDGSRFPAAGRVVSLHQPSDGARVGFAKIVCDASQMRTLQESERKFREIFESANEGIWILDANARVLSVNPRMAELLGYAVDEMVGRAKSDFVFPEDAERVRAIFEERRRGLTAVSLEIRFRHRSGRPVWMLLSARPLIRDGVFQGSLDLFTEITQRREAEERFRLFFESAAAGHALVEPVTRRFIAVNPRFAEICGWSRDELMQMTFADITHPDDRVSDAAQFSAVIAGETSEIAREKRYVRPDGRIVWASLTSTIVRDEKDRPTLQLSVIQDITERRATEQALADSRTRLRLAIEAAELGLFFHDGATGEDTWNDQAKQLLGLPREIEGSLAVFLEHLHPEDKERVSAGIQRVLRAAGTPLEFAMEFRVLWPDGTLRHLAANGVSQPSGAAGVAPNVVGTVRDVTASKQFELELRQKVEQRTRELQEKTNQLESFCYTVAHDLRAPLRSINGYADIVLEELDTLDRQRARSYLDRIKASTLRLDQLIRDLLGYSRIGQVGVTLERVDLHAALLAAVQENADEARRCEAKVSLPHTLPIVWAEPSLLESALANLLGNALKFTPAGIPPKVEVFAEGRDALVRLCIRDHGIGIAPEYHHRIFRVFERLQSSRDYPGTGIGLAIVAKAMERMNGSCGVESSPGLGSTFWIELRRAEPEP